MIRSSPLARIAFLAATLFVLYAVDVVGAGLDDALLAAPWSFAAMALVDSLVVGWAVGRSRLRGWRAVAAVGLAFYAVKTVLVAVEAVYLSDVLPAHLVASLFANGALVAAIYVPIVVWAMGRFESPAAGSPPCAPAISGLAHQWRGWLWRVPLAGLLYLVLFVAAGAVVFRGAATAIDPAAATAYLEGFEATDPTRVLGLQWLRGMLWLVLVMPWVRSLSGGVARVGLVAGSFFAVLMASSFLVPTGLPAAVVPAHALEVATANLAFGFVVAWLVGRSHAGPVAGTLGQRVQESPGESQGEGDRHSRGGATS
jgi:hypothetical protein